MVDQQLPENVKAVLPVIAPGTVIRDGLERILRGKTGALILLGHDAEVEKICDGGFRLDVELSATRLRELSKMDGAVVLTTDLKRIVRANVQLVPDASIPTVESGTRHRAAERTAIQTAYPVISVSQSTGIVSVYTAHYRYTIAGPAEIISRANQALTTLERYKTRFTETNRQLFITEMHNDVTLREVLGVVQLLEMMRRLSDEIGWEVIELGSDGLQISLQLEDLVGGNEQTRELILRDYLFTEGAPSIESIDKATQALDAISSTELLSLSVLARALGYLGTIEALDQPMYPRGYRIMHMIPRLQFHQIHRVIDTFGSLQKLLSSAAIDFENVTGIDSILAEYIREGLTRLAETITN